MFGIVSVYNYYQDGLKPIRTEIERFRDTKFDSCIITQVSIRYPQFARGNYKVFYTSCSSKDFPFIVESEDMYNYDSLILVNSVIIKYQDSLSFRIMREGSEFHFKTVDPKEFDDRWTTSIVSFCFLSVITVIITLIPNAEYERRFFNKRAVRNSR
jgi:hypothetical protein